MSKIHRPHPTALVPGVRAVVQERRAKTRQVEERYPDTLDRLVAENERRKRRLSRRLELLSDDELAMMRDGLVVLEESDATDEDRRHDIRRIRADVEAELDLRERSPRA